MNRSFRIPLGVMALGLVACNGDADPEDDTGTPATTPVPTGPVPTPPATVSENAFEGIWDLNRVEYSGYGYSGSQDYPYSDGNYTISADIEITPTAFSLNVLQVYTDGEPDYSYVQGPYSWVENDAGRLEVQGYADADFFICDHEEDDLDSLRCRLGLDGGTSDLLLTRQP